MAQKDDIIRNVAKIAAAVGLTWIGYKIVTGLANNKSSSEIVKETVEPISNAASEVKKITRKFLKGSPEAKEYMRKLRSMPRKKKAATDSEVIKENKLTGKEAEKVKEGKPSLKKNLKSNSKSMSDKEYKKFKSFEVKL
jgi:cobyric acid synthase